MLDIKWIRENKEKVFTNCQNRGVRVDLDALLQADEKRRSLISQIEALRAERKKKSKGKPSPEEIEALQQQGKALKELEEALKPVEIEFLELMYQVPNMTHPDSPVGKEGEGTTLEQRGTIPEFTFTPKDHLTLLTEQGMLDFERGAKVSGAKFYFSKGLLVRLNLALINYGIDKASSYGYELIETPDLAKNDILQGIGFNPRGEETNIYSVEGTDLSLIGTSEITMGGYHAGEILDLSQGPKKYVALSHCYRTEAGAYGRESKGLYRVHQFTKLELFVFCRPEDSEAYHQEILEIEKSICDGLGFAYKVVDIPTEDLGGPAYRKFDLEAWMASKEEGGGFGEITSCSNCTDYQARRLNIRYRDEDGKLQFVHTLNGTAIVSSRFPLVIAENYQEKNGKIAFPAALEPYLGFIKS